MQKRLYPEIETSTVIAWQRNIPYSPATSRFIEEINAYARSQSMPKKHNKIYDISIRHNKI